MAGSFCSCSATSRNGHSLRYGGWMRPSRHGSPQIWSRLVLTFGVKLDEKLGMLAGGKAPRFKERPAPRGQFRCRPYYFASPRPTDSGVVLSYRPGDCVGAQGKNPLAVELTRWLSRNGGQVSSYGRFTSYLVRKGRAEASLKATCMLSRSTQLIPWRIELLV